MWERGEMCMEMEGEGGMRRERVDRFGVPLETGEPVVKRAANRLKGN